MKRSITGTVALLLLVLISSCCGCKGNRSKSALPVEGTSWKLVELNGKRLSAFNTEPNSFTLELDKKESRITGAGACNRFFGSYNLSGGTGINLQPGGMTRMACPNMDLESEYVRTLEEATGYSIDSGMLMLQKNGQVIAIFQGSKK